MARKPADEHIRELVKTGSGFVPVPEQARLRVFAAISQKTARHAKPRASRILRYSPGLAAVAAALIAIPLAVVLGFAIISRPAATGLVAASDKGGIIENRGSTVIPGTAIASEDVIATGVHEQVSLYYGQTLALHVFSNTRLGISKPGIDATAAESAAADSFAMDLKIGTFYINRKAVADEKLPDVAVDVDSYTFTLMGTRVLFSVAADRTITIICYEGIVNAHNPLDQAGQKTSEALPVINAGMKVIIDPAGLWKFIKAGNWLHDEKAVDEELRENVSPTEYFREISFPGTVTINDAAADKELPPYSVTRIGSIAGSQTAADKVNFFAAIHAGNRSYAINQESLYLINTYGVARGPVLPYGASFKVPLASSSNFICLSTASSVILVNTSTLAVSSIQLPDDGSIDHAYVPRIAGNKLVVPVQNKGYYTADISNLASGLTLLSAEQFPISPLVFGSTVITGSYYNKILAGVDMAVQVSATGSAPEKFRVSLAGSPFANPVFANDSIYVAVDSGTSARIERYSSMGEKTGSWNLNSGMSTDFVASGKYVAGILSDGDLFILDTASGLVKKPTRLFAQELSSRQRRSAGILMKGGAIYAGTDQGVVIKVDLAQAAIIAEIKTADAGIYVPCFGIGEDVFCIDNSGSVYRIAENKK